MSPALRRAGCKGAHVAVGLKGTYSWLKQEPSRPAWAQKAGPLSDQIASTVFEHPECAPEVAPIRPSRVGAFTSRLAGGKF